MPLKTTIKKKRFRYPHDIKDHLAVRETKSEYLNRLDIPSEKICDCKPSHINCQSAKEWIEAQLGVW